MSSRFLLAGGGTAGHVEPALAVAAELRSRGHEVWLLGTATGAESVLAPERGIPLLLIDKVPAPRHLNREALAFPLRLIRTVRGVRRYLRDYKIDAVMGFGGYVAGAAFVAARGHVPSVVFSYDAKPGVANRLAARWTQHIAVGAPTDDPQFGHAVVSGIPLRESLRSFHRDELRAQALTEFGLTADRRTLVAFGGSLGAQRINDAVIGCGAELVSRGWQVIHIAGTRNADAFNRSQMLQAKGHWCARDYVTDMAAVYAAADIVMCRAGAMTCAELTATGTPAVLVPYAVGNGEQNNNAQELVARGGYTVIDDSALTPDVLLATLANDGLLDTLTRAARNLRESGSAQPDSAAVLASLLESTVSR